MQDKDWIEFGCVFEDFPSRSDLESLLNTFPLAATEPCERSELHISVGEEDGSTEKWCDGPQAAITTLRENAGSSIRAGFDGYQLRIGCNRRRGILSTMPHLRVRETVYPFTDPQDDEYLQSVARKRKDFVERLAEISEKLTPSWGFGRPGGLAIGEEQSIEELATATRPPLYEYNALREETVQTIGRERILDIDAEYVREMETGGVFVALKQPPTSCGTYSKQYMDIAEYLGLPHADLSRYH